MELYLELLFVQFTYDVWWKIRLKILSPIVIDLVWVALLLSRTIRIYIILTVKGFFNIMLSSRIHVIHIYFRCCIIGNSLHKMHSKVLNAFESVNIWELIIIDIFTFYMMFDIDIFGLIAVISAVEEISVMYLIPKFWYENARAYKV